jgi:GTP-binding protein Era
MTRCGIVALAGRPNVGKSSLLNAILGTDLSMVSPKAQATRLPVTGIHTRGDTQFILQDLPGLLDPAYPLQQAMRQLALEALDRADVVLHLHPVTDSPAPALASLIGDVAPPRGPVLAIGTKADLAGGAGPGPEALRISSRDPASVERLLDLVEARLPEGPFRHDPDEIGTQPLRFFVVEYLREAAFALLEDELPYAVTAEVDEFREDRRPVYIRATLFVERDSQKGIVIGKGGAVLKRIGAHARARLEALIGEPVYLETWVKVLPRWRKSLGALARFGFPVPRDEVS